MMSSRGVQPNRCLRNLQKIVRNYWQQQNPWKISLSKLRISKNAVLLYATLLYRKNEYNIITSQVSSKAFREAFLITAILQNSSQMRV